MVVANVPFNRELLLTLLRSTGVGPVSGATVMTSCQQFDVFLSHNSKDKQSVPRTM